MYLFIIKIEKYRFFSEKRLCYILHPNRNCQTCNIQMGAELIELLKYSEDACTYQPYSERNLSTYLRHPDLNPEQSLSFTIYT